MKNITLFLMKGEIDTVYNNSMESIFAEIEETKTRLADEQNKKREVK